MYPMYEYTYMNIGPQRNRRGQEPEVQDGVQS